MTRSKWRVLTALLVAQAVPAVLLLPAEHVHLGSADHPSSIAHRHAAIHDLDGDEDLDSDGIVVPNDDDDHVAWLPTAFVGQHVFTPPIPYATIVRIHLSDPIVTWTNTHRAASSARTHGPPGQPPTLRGPPIISVQI